MLTVLCCHKSVPCAVVLSCQVKIFEAAVVIRTFLFSFTDVGKVNLNEAIPISELISEKLRSKMKITCDFKVFCIYTK